jgi:ABC-2 type transport system ATP-binding protein
VLVLDGVTKSYGERRVLDDVGFTIGAGRMTGFVGGNGAGKTTTMRIILGVLAADAGTVLIDGTPISAAARRRFGYMPEERGLYPKMRVREQLVYLARLHGWTAAAAGRSADELLEQLDLTARADDPLESLSLGNQQRAQIAAALVHRPDVLVLDEPFSGLDVMAVDLVQNVLKDRASGGVPVLFSSHQLDVVERLCDDLVIISGGRIRAAGSTHELRERHARQVWELTVDEPDWVPRWLDGRGRVTATTATSVQVEAPDDVRRELLATAVERGPVHSWRHVQPSLAEIFREVVG